MNRPLLALIAIAWLIAPSLSAAFESSFSGFGTLGYARSDRPYAYQRFINDSGTFKRDSIVGLQVDNKLSDEFSFTVQAKAAASADSDSGVDASISWGFLSYRPSNDLLLRAGKFRVPLYLHSETTDVGTTFEQMRLPMEVYSQSPTVDFKGLSGSKSWNFGNADVVLDGYWGKARTKLRFWFRDGVEPIQPAGVEFLPISVEVRGLALSLHRAEDTFRAAYTHAVATRRTDLLFARSYPFVQIPGLPGVGYFQTLDGVVSNQLPMTRKLVVPVITLAADVKTRFGIRLVGEYGRRIVNDTELGFDTAGAYVAMMRRTGRWTPYVSYGVLRSTARNRATYAALNVHTVPNFIPGAAMINTLQRAGADGSPTFDQRSLAIGTSYLLSPTSKVKAEIQRVRIGQVSALVDALPGTDVRHQSISILSLSYSFVF